MDRIKVMLGIYFLYNTFSHPCVQHKNYPEHATLCLSILIHCLFFVFALINDTIFAVLFRQMLLEFLGQTCIIVFGASVHLDMRIKLF